MKKNKENNKYGFTLVELLAVIVILAIILVIAVPKVMSVIEDSKKATLESTAKMIASSAEKAKVQNTVLGKDEEITCDSVAKINKLDYASCSIEFEDNTAKVTIAGKGKFEGLYVCSGDKTTATAQTEACAPQVQSIEVNHPLFFKGQSLTTDKFEVMATYSDGSVRKLHSGGIKIDEGETITFYPDWPENSNDDNIFESENYYEATYENAESLQITFDVSAEFEYSGSNYIVLYDKDGNKIEEINGNKTTIIMGNYVKLTLKSEYSPSYFSYFEATIKPMYTADAEYTVSPNVTPNTDGNFDINITLIDENITKKITTNVGPHDADDYVVSQKGFDVVQTTETYIGENNKQITLDTGIRYVGDLTGENAVKNQVYFNCEETDGRNSYGNENYDYASSCEIWRIIGAFEVEDENCDKGQRVKLINTNSTFYASWDSSDVTVNEGWGINQWGESTYKDGSIYEGADLMQLLNGYYIGKENSTCTYCNDWEQETCEQVCDTNEKTLASQNMKPLTSNALNMVDEAVWYTYAYSYNDAFFADSREAGTAYLQEKGITKKYIGCDVEATTTTECADDGVIRKNKWIGLVGLMSISDSFYANGWLYGYNDGWTITPGSMYSTPSDSVWSSSYRYGDYGGAMGNNYIYPSVYLHKDVKIIGGNGDTEPYKLAM